MTALAGVGLAAPPGAVAADRAERDHSVTGACSERADYRLRMVRDDGRLAVRVRVEGAGPGSRWNVELIYTAGDGSVAQVDAATASAEGSWRSGMRVGRARAHYTVMLRAESRAGQLCAVRYRQ